jgi:hypothetical protein
MDLSETSEQPGGMVDPEEPTPRTTAAHTTATSMRFAAAARTEPNRTDSFCFRTEAEPKPLLPGLFFFFLAKVLR